MAHTLAWWSRFSQFKYSPLNSQMSLTTHSYIHTMAAHEPEIVVALLKILLSSSSAKQKAFKAEWSQKVSSVACHVVLYWSYYLLLNRWMMWMDGRKAKLWKSDPWTKLRWCGLQTLCNMLTVSNIQCQQQQSVKDPGNTHPVCYQKNFLFTVPNSILYHFLKPLHILHLFYYPELAQCPYGLKDIQ